MTYEEWKKGRIQMLKLSNEESHQLTIECIEEALVELMEIKKFEEITVTDIVKKAGISRTAYYKNFKSKDEILWSIMGRKCETLLSTWELSITAHDNAQISIWTKLFEVVKENARYMRCIFKSGKGDMLLDYSNSFAVRNNPNSGIENEYMLVYVSGAVYSMLRRWVLAGMKETPEEMAAILNKL